MRTLVQAEERRWIEDLRKYFFAYQEIPQLGSIFAFLKEPPHPKANWRQAFRKILSGHYFPGVGDGRARDTQAELFFASLAKSVGYGVELGDSRLRDSGLGEPDVVVSSGGDRFAVEAKRPHSFLTIGSRVKEAAKQIAKRGLDGLIFLDLSLALDERWSALESRAKDPRRLATPDKVPWFQHMVREYLINEARKASAVVPQTKNGARVFGITAFASSTVIIGEPPPARSWLPGVVWCGRNLPLNPFGERFYWDLESRYATNAAETRRQQIWWKEPSSPNGLVPPARHPYSDLIVPPPGPYLILPAGCAGRFAGTRVNWQQAAFPQALGTPYRQPRAAFPRPHGHRSRS